MLKRLLLGAVAAMTLPCAASAADLSGAWIVKADFGPDGGAKGLVSTRLSTGQFEATPLPELSSALTAAWKVDVGFSDQIKYVLLCAFKSEGSKLGGPCAIIQGANLQARGAADGPNFSLAYDTTFQGRPVHVDYAGAFQPEGSVKGKVTAGESAGTSTTAKP